ncbi:unnamed protein product [Spirodela intermedia]|uniref:DUF4219 domain-containing protein n=1 Tax=Spirodela intermedia TaxID=51605 RepID=A0A7I8L6T8_SPIIN|nr:unnamed protein product [Spirodela intermedia]
MEGESSLAASGAVKVPGDAGYLGTFPVFNKTNYPVWVMHMQLHLEAHSLWDAIESETIARKKDRQALSVMLEAVSEDIQRQLNITKMAKETWELFKATYVTKLGRFDLITTSLDHSGDIDSMSFEEVEGSLKIYEEKLKLEKISGGPARGRGRGRGRGWLRKRKK